MIYLDTSALVKLIVKEPETGALRRFITKADPKMFVTSALTRAELFRVAIRQTDASVLRKAREVLDAVSEMTITHSLLETAGTVGPPHLRTLDAIHLVTALEFGKELDAFVAYDTRLLAAAEQAGLATRAPGAGR